MWRCCVFLLALAARAQGKLDTEEDDTAESDEKLQQVANETTTQIEARLILRVGDRELDDNNSSEHIGAAVTQIARHPYAAALLRNDSYECSAVILNNYWVLTESKCFDPAVVSSYLTHRNLKNYTVRVGSSYNNKGGSLYKITTLINNFDLKVTAVKLNSPLEYNSRIRPVRLPAIDEEPTFGYLASIVAWTPVGHMRIVNAPVIEPSICDSLTKLMSGHYICLGGVQDLNRHFCRKDNGGAVIQNNTLIGIASFLHSCAIYTRTHAFPKISSFTRWLDSVIWDENNRPTTVAPTTTKPTTEMAENVTETTDDRTPFFPDPRKFMLTLPFDPVNVPLVPNGDNSVIPRMSLYESYLQNIARAKTSTTMDPNEEEHQKQNRIDMDWMKKYGKYRNAVMMMPQSYPGKRYMSNQLRYSANDI